ncbi:hypothetical protein BHM03_00062613 [Ensete ventricosum]|nr:hypothetical protein BHM03_00062613 [Ensete ventricosum]
MRPQAYSCGVGGLCGGHQPLACEAAACATANVRPVQPPAVGTRGRRLRDLRVRPPLDAAASVCGHRLMRLPPMRVRPNV